MSHDPTKLLYLDYAAATPVDDEVFAAMQPFFAQQFYNPSATYNAGRGVRAALESARREVSQTVGVKPSEVVFTAGGTEANNLAITGVMSLFPDAEVLVSGVEHESVLRPAAQYGAHEIAVDAQGMVLLEDVRARLTDATVLISVMYANNEVGTVQPLRRLAELVAAARHDRRRRGIALPLYLHTDACQAGNYLDLHVARLGVDMMTLNGGKLYGPKQSGALIVSSNVQLAPQIRGGGQERGMRSGTENVAGAVGFARALAGAQQHADEAAAAARQLQTAFLGELQRLLPQLHYNGAHKKRLPNNIHITIPGADNERLLFALDERGILAAAGSACTASNEEPSHVLRAMGIADRDAQASLRFTFGKHTTEEQLRFAAQTLAEVVALEQK